MNISVPRFKSDEFRLHLLKLLSLTPKVMPPHFVLKHVYVLASDGRDRRLEQGREYPASLTYTGKFCEGEILTGLRFEFGDGTSETVEGFRYEGAAELTLSINF